ncbi:MAG: hypothetical protein CV045_02825 [Cyanobacteria bacterium M5B4]|nr:MAG: hypothetical protein CV045_02825 [Cyanobacteria bacterium M5B4]
MDNFNFEWVEVENFYETLERKIAFEKDDQVKEILEALAEECFILSQKMKLVQDYFDKEISRDQLGDELKELNLIGKERY